MKEFGIVIAQNAKHYSYSTTYDKTIFMVSAESAPKYLLKSGMNVLLFHTLGLPFFTHDFIEYRGKVADEFSEISYSIYDLENGKDLVEFSKQIENIEDQPIKHFFFNPSQSHVLDKLFTMDEDPISRKDLIAELKRKVKEGIEKEKKEKARKQLETLKEEISKLDDDARIQLLSILIGKDKQR